MCWLIKKFVLRKHRFDLDIRIITGILLSDFWSDYN